MAELSTIIQTILKCHNNKVPVNVSLSNDEHVTGEIESFDGTSVQVKGTTVSVFDILEINEVLPNPLASMLMKRISINTLERSVDAVLMSYDEKNISIISESGSQIIAICDIKTLTDTNGVVVIDNSQNINSELVDCKNEYSASNEQLVNLESRDMMSITIEEMGLSIDTYNALRRANIRDIADLAAMKERELLQIRNIGKTGYKEILDAINRLSENTTPEIEEKSSRQTIRSTLDIPTFNSELIPGSYFIFEEQIAKSKMLTIEEINECIVSFEEQKYDAARALIGRKINEGVKESTLNELADYLDGVVERYDIEESNLEKDQSSFYKGIVASKIELDYDKGFAYFIQACKESPDKTVKALYRALVGYFSTNNIERAAEAADLIKERLWKYQPEYDQAICLKSIVSIYELAQKWDKSLETLVHLVQVSESHPIACYNSIMKYLQKIENNTRDDRIEKLYLEALRLNVDPFAVLLRLSNYYLYQIAGAIACAR